MNESLFKEYAKLIVKKGVNVQPNQMVMINAPVEVYEFVRILVKECYNAGASCVEVDYSDMYNYKEKINNVSLENLTNIPDHVSDRMKFYVDKGFCRISLTSPDASAAIGMDLSKQKVFNMASAKKMKFMQDYFMANMGQWCVAGVSSKAWADKVFPGKENSVELLWEAIFKASHVKEEGTVEAWEAHSNEITEHAKKLNNLNLDKLVFKNSLGTNLEVYLAEDNVFAGGDEYSETKVRFSPNIPTEEVFGMPYKTKVNGIVYASKPLNYGGTLINEFYLEFKDGKVVNYDAKEGKEALRNLVEFDDGSSYLGEVALLSYHSPISMMNVLFFNTLYDENASCHLALGAAYPMNVKDGVSLSQDELAQKGANFSNTHVDFMFGTSDMTVIGTTKDGKEIQIFENGDFII